MMRRIVRLTALALLFLLAMMSGMLVPPALLSR